MQFIHSVVLSTVFLVFTAQAVSGQSKVSEVGQSKLTGMTLPKGSKQDKRLLYVSSAEMLLEMVSKQRSATVKNTEVLYLRPISETGYTIDSLKAGLQKAGWKVTPVGGEPQYLWLEQHGKNMLAFFSSDKKAANLYLGECVMQRTPVPGPTGSQVQQGGQVQKPLGQQGQPGQQPTGGGNPAKPARQGGYYFTTTNFDDGWISVETRDWVEVSKPGLKIIIHYPNQLVDEYTSVKLDADYRAWNTLVVPRYSNISNVAERGIQDYESVTFLTADATDATGRRVYLVLFKKWYDTGLGRYMEIVADNRAAFEREFGSNYINRSSWEYMDQVKSWDKLAVMQWRNRFAIDLNDLSGKWKSSTYAALRYYYVNSGGFAGATATSIADEFVFAGDGTYQSDHSGASGVVGNQKFSRQVYKGRVSVTNWSVTLTNRFDNQTEAYNSYFEAIRGGRLLVMTDRTGNVLTLARAMD